MSLSPALTIKMSPSLLIFLIPDSRYSFISVSTSKISSGTSLAVILNFAGTKFFVPSICLSMQCIMFPLGNMQATTQAEGAIFFTTSFTGRGDFPYETPPTLTIFTHHVLYAH
eukprot:TRINITY_DN17140_c0_g1_i2.p1 TRINITY_DN17140_c0_g1~~TRINITY_DN17140_c0_g1_i2.p1  ORF type:complete len:113 (+),score=15.19 TRINITY_DN17140_c0_g1_i2:118-456(+)